MAVVKILAYDVIPGKEADVVKQFHEQRGILEREPGLLEIELLRPTAGETRYLLYTRWDSEESAAGWFGRFLPHEPDGSGPIKKARTNGERDFVPPLTPDSRLQRRRRALRSRTTSAYAVLEFDVV